MPDQRFAFGRGAEDPAYRGFYRELLTLWVRCLMQDGVAHAPSLRCPLAIESEVELAVHMPRACPGQVLYSTRFSARVLMQASMCAMGSRMVRELWTGIVQSSMI